MGEEITEPSEILRKTRVEVMPYLREIAEHSRAIIPRMEVSKRWIDYYEALSKVRPLTEKEKRRLEEHRKAYNLLEARREIYRAAGRYARTKKVPDLLSLRLAQRKYYAAKAEMLPPEKAKGFGEKFVPPKELYERLRKVQEEIRAKCKSYKEAKYRLVPITTATRRARMKTLGAELRDLYVEAYDLTQRGKSVSGLIEHYKEMKKMGAE